MSIPELLLLLLNSATLALVAGLTFKSGRWAGRVEEAVASIKDRLATLERAILPPTWRPRGNE